MTMKQNKEKFDFKAFGQAIKAARKAKGISRNQLAKIIHMYMLTISRFFCIVLLKGGNVYVT